MHLLWSIPSLQEIESTRIISETVQKPLLHFLSSFSRYIERLSVTSSLVITHLRFIDKQ